MDDPLMWFTTDLDEEAITSLEHVAELIPSTQTQPWRWKWAVIGLDNALQNLFVLAVKHTTGLNVLRVKQADIEAWHAGIGDFPEGDLLPFLELFEKVQGEEMLKFVGSRPLEVSPHEDSLVRWLHRRRNEFVHYKPMGLSVDLDSFRVALGAGAKVAERLVFDTGTIMWDNADQDARVRYALSSIGAALES